MITFDISNKTTILDAPDFILDTIRKEMTLENPVYLDARKYGRRTRDLDRYLFFYDEFSYMPGMEFPRGYTGQAIRLCIRNKIPYKIVDNRTKLPQLNLKFTKELRPYQVEAVNDMLKKDFGLLRGGTGSGKTITGISIIVKRNVPSLIICHSRELCLQWVERLVEFTNLTEDDIGRVWGGQFDLKPVTVGLINSVNNKLDQLVGKFCHTLTDEVHRLPGLQFSKALSAFDGQYNTGLTATPWRRDGLTRLIFYYCGDQQHVIDPDHLREIGAILTPDLEQRDTSFQYQYRNDYANMISALVLDSARNKQITNDISKELKRATGIILVVSDRTEHLKVLLELTQKNNPSAKCGLLTGSVSNEKRAEIVNDMKNQEMDAVFATTSLIAEGFDEQSLSVLMMTTPIKFSGRVLQITGRICRPMRNGQDKKPTIIDYVDCKIGVLENSAKHRLKTFQNEIKCNIKAAA